MFKNIKVRLFTGGYKNNSPIYRIFDFIKWAFVMPVKFTTGRDIRDTYHGYVWRNGRVHKGVDFIGYKGQSVFASGAGKIVKIGYDPYYGNYIIIQHGKNNGYTLLTLYAHLENFFQGWVDKPTGNHIMPTIKYTKLNDIVKKGQRIGSVGDTGDSDCYHLHFEMHILGIDKATRQTLPLEFSKAVDPVPFLPEDEFLKRYKIESEQNEKLPNDLGL